MFSGIITNIGKVKQILKKKNNCQLEIVSKLNPVSYNKIGFEENEVGFIAQEVEKFLPQLVREDEKGIKSLAYGNMNAILVKAIQELKAEIEILKSK